MKVNISGRETYIPKWNGNQKLPKAEQVSVEYRYMTCEEEEKYSNFVPKYSMEANAAKEVELEIKPHANEIWDLCVTKVSGLFDENGKEITDPKAVRKVPGLYELITEVSAEIRKGIQEADSKN